VVYTGGENRRSSEVTKQFWALIAVVVVVMVGVFAFSGHKSGTSSGSGQAKLSEHITGKGQKGVTLIEYGDFQCPACEGYEQTVEQVRSKYADDIYFQFRNFPLTNLHPNAFAAARAAEAASLQGKFWEMHDLLYAQVNWQQWTQSSNPSDYFNRYATQLGLDVNKFKDDFASDAVNGTVNADLNEANRLGLNGTPSFFLDGKKLDSVQPDINAFSKLIDAEIAKKNPGSTTQNQQ
jgi:protein-disulfide isomerase